MSVSGADLVVEALRANGVEVVFGLPGVHNLPLWRSLEGSGIRLVTVRHEQAAAYAADGYARATGRTGVAFTTTGPGAANTLGAVGEAWAGRSPIVVVATDIPSTLRRPGVYRGALHETTDQAAMFVPVVKSVMLVRDAEDSGEVMARALAEAAAPPSRPVYVEIPTDYLSASVADERRAVTVGGAEPGGPLDEDAIQRAVALLDSAERPLVWAGGGAVASGAGPAIGQLAERLVAPIVTTYQARGLVGRDHPCAVGVPPHVQAVGSLWDEADVVVGIGTDFDGMMTQNWRMPPPKHLITVNVDNVDASKNYQPDVMIGADASVGVNALTGKLAARQGLPELEKQLATLRLDVREELRAEYPEAVEFLDEFEGAVPRDSVVVCDMCIPGYWLSAFHPVSAPRQLAYPMGWGTLGFAFPAAMGTALGADVPVVSVSGDGGFLFACGELATVAKEQIPLTIVIVDDGGYGMLRFDQRNSGEQPFGVDLNPPDFVALANSFGVDAEAVDGLSKEFGRALADHMKARTPSVLVATASLEPPPTTSPRWYRPR